MKLYRVSIGHTELFAAGIDAEDIYNRRESLDHTFAYLPIVIEEVKLEGYEITVSRIAGDTNPILENANATIEQKQEWINSMGKDLLKNYLRANNIEFTPQWGEQKLRELALSVA